jgi:hypothetical protein
VIVHKLTRAEEMCMVPIGNGSDHVTPHCHPWHYLVCHWDSHDEIKEALVPSASMRRAIEPVEDGRLPNYVRPLATDGKNALDNGPEVVNDLAGVVLIDRDR